MQKFRTKITCQLDVPNLPSVDVSDIFYFFLLGGGQGGVRGAGKGRELLFTENPREEGRRGVGRVFARNLGGRGAKYFFSGPKLPPSTKRRQPY